MPRKITEKGLRIQAELKAGNRDTQKIAKLSGASQASVISWANKMGIELIKKRNTNKTSLGEEGGVDATKTYHDKQYYEESVDGLVLSNLPFNWRRHYSQVDIDKLSIDLGFGLGRKNIIEDSINRLIKKYHENL